MSLGKLAQGGFWLFMATAISGFMGYLYLFAASKFVTPEIIGSVGVVISLQTVITGMISFGIPRGLQRFLGECLGKRDHELFAQYFMTSFLFALIVNVLAAVAVVSIVILGTDLFALGFVEILFASVLLFLSGWSTVIQALFHSTLRTVKISIATFVSSVAKFAVGITLLFAGLDFVAVMLGYLSAYLVLDGFLLLFVMKYFGANNIKIRRSMLVIKRPLLAQVLRSGISVWIPTALRTAGEKIGVLGVYALVSSAGAGLYFIAFSMALALISIPSSMLALLLPVLSGMSDGRKRMLARALKLSLAITAPLALMLMIYPGVFLSLIGPEYVEASGALAILALSALVAPIVIAYSSYILALGKNVHVLIVGLTLSISQLALSFLLIPQMGDTGAAIAYTAGYYISLAAILPSGHKIGHKFNWIEMLKVVAIPVSFAAVLFAFDITWIFGIPILLLGSLISYTRLGIITKNDLVEVLRGFISEKSISRGSAYARPLLKLLFGN
jgi:O-antigen/teichoic acid export membrane protein